MENIPGVDYRHGEIICKGFNKKNIGDYYDLYVRSDTSLLADVFENFRNKCIEIYELDPTNFLSAPRFDYANIFKKDRNRIRIINWR